MSTPSEPRLVTPFVKDFRAAGGKDLRPREYVPPDLPKDVEAEIAKELEAEFGSDLDPTVALWNQESLLEDIPELSTEPEEVGPPPNNLPASSSTENPGKNMPSVQNSLLETDIQKTLTPFSLPKTSGAK